MFFGKVHHCADFWCGAFLAPFFRKTGRGFLCFLRFLPPPCQQERNPKLVFRNCKNTLISSRQKKHMEKVSSNQTLKNISDSKPCPHFLRTGFCPENQGRPYAFFSASTIFMQTEANGIQRYCFLTSHENTNGETEKHYEERRRNRVPQYSAFVFFDFALVFFNKMWYNMFWLWPRDRKPYWGYRGLFRRAIIRGRDSNRERGEQKWIL